MGGEFPVSTRIQVPSSIEELGEAIIKAIVRIEADYQQNVHTKPNNTQYSETLFRYSYLQFTSAQH